MENFRPSSNESSDDGDNDSESHESFDDSESSDDSVETSSGSGPEAEDKKSVFFSKEELNEGESKGFFSESGLMDSLLGEATGSESGTEGDLPSIADIENSLVNDQFTEVVEGRISDILPNGSAEESADAAFLENVAEGLSVEGVDPDAAIEAAIEESIEGEIGLSEEGNLEDSPHLPDMEHISEILNPPVGSASEEEPAAPTPAPVVPVTPPPTAMPPGPPPPPVSPPPMPPFNPNVFNTQASSAAPNAAPVNPVFNPNAAPTNPNLATASPNAAPDSPDESRMNSLYSRDKNTGKVILGGAIGYLLGRRRGRKKTEAILQPKIDSLDNKVGKLTDKLDQSEDFVKKQARATESLQTNLRETQDQLKEASAVKEVLIPGAVVEGLVVEVAPAAMESPIEKVEHLAMSAAAEKSAIDKQEHQLADLLTIDNAPKPPEVEYAMRTEELDEEVREIKKRAAVAADLESEFRLKTKEVNIKTPDVKTMRVSELLEAAKSIKINSVSLKDMYENKRIDVVNLRRIVQEHARGGNIDKLVNGATEAVELRRELRNEAMPEEPVFDLASASAGIEKRGAPSSRNISQDVNMAGATGLSVPLVAAENRSTSGSIDAENAVSSVIEKDTTMRVSTNTAVALGVVTGVLITAIVLLYSGAF